MTVRRMVNPVMAYAWGSREGIARVQGRPASDEAEAELWMGAHPLAPSRLEADDTSPEESLDVVIATDPSGTLGERVLERFGPRLPFLLKVLAAEHPLSLQVHPDDDQARRGFDAEDAAGIERDAPNRSYRDPYAKPEMLLALTDFSVLQGFRPGAEAAAAIEALGIERLRGLVEALRAGTPPGEVFLRLIEWPSADRAALLDDVRESVGTSGEGLGNADGAGAIDRLLARLAIQYPADPAVVGVLLLNYLTLQASQALYVPAGQIHSYVQGTGVEILGGSDNVIRGGLTPKHISVAELATVLARDATEPLVIDPVTDADGSDTWPTPQREFELRRFNADGTGRQLPSRGPTVLLCLEGKLEIGDGDGSAVTIGPGESAFAPASATSLDVGGSGVAICANPGPAW